MSRASPVLQRMLAIVGPFLAVVALLAAAAMASMDVLSGIRAFVGAESLWSKAQKRAVHHLIRYAQNRSDFEYDDYRKVMQVPLGDRWARLALDRAQPDVAAATAAFVAGGNDPADVPAMIRLYRYFRHIDEVAQAIEIWSQADEELLVLMHVAEQMHEHLKASGPADRGWVEHLEMRVRNIDQRLTVLEEAFSVAIGNAGRKARQLLLLFMLLSTCALTSAGVILARRMVIKGVQAEAALRRSELRLRVIFDSAPTAMAMFDRAGRAIIVNSEMERLFGYARDEMHALQVDALMPQSYRAQHLKRIARFLEAPRSHRLGGGREVFALRKDGSQFPVEIGLNRLETDAGPAVLAAVVDISERRRLADAALQEKNEALRRSNEALERSNIELQRFAYIASHDLQTPMRSISNFAELLETHYAAKLDARGGDWVRRTVLAVGRLRQLVRDLLEYSRVDAQQRPFERVNLRGVVDEAIGLLEHDILEAGACCEVGELPEVLGDRSQLSQLILNLLGNALKYRGAEAPRIAISARSEGGSWRVQVRDNGIGIDARHHQRIFEIFQRLHDAAEYPGTGIGLAVCRRVVLRHGGQIWVESAPNSGSSFLFTIPDPDSRA